MRFRCTRASLFAVVAVFIAAAAPGEAQTLVSTNGPFVFTDSCEGGEVRITLRVYKDLPGLPGLYKWDYEIQNISLHNPPEAPETPQVDGVGSMSLGWLGAVPELANVYSPTGWETYADTS